VLKRSFAVAKGSQSLLISVTAMAAIPFASEAKSPSAVALDACVKAFVETHLPNYSVRQFKKDVPVSSPIEAYWGSRTYTVALSAHAADSGDLVAQAHCVANRRGVVVMLVPSGGTEPLPRADFTVSLR
jgi:hypothetical protein